MNKKIMVLCLGLLSLVVLSGCNANGTAQKYCLSKGYSGSKWINDWGTNMDFYCTKEVRSETISDFEYDNIKECGERQCPKPEYQHKHKEHPKRDEVVVIVEKTIVKEHTLFDDLPLCFKQEVLDDSKYPACKEWCNEDGTSKRGHSYTYLCFHNCKSEKLVCE